MPAPDAPPVLKWTQEEVDSLGADKGFLPAAYWPDDRKAEDFARRVHADQTYDGHSYANGHLVKVVQVVKDFGFFGSHVEAAWLHDAIEDTDETFSSIEAEFGTTVASIVWGCSGDNGDRAAHMASVYAKIEAFPKAAIVKTADRIANVEAGKADGRHRLRYLKEASPFARNVLRYVPLAMSERLERAYVA
jgi:(p)ppGpp synthase/HD superfamily hydrolase